MMKTILVVDDDKNICNICSHFLQQAGYKVTTCALASDALNLIQREDFQLALVDVNLPDSNGKELLQKIKTIKPRMEVLVISAHGNIQIAVECMKLGAADFIEKPFTKERLLSCVEKSLKLKGMSDEIARLQTELKKIHKFDTLIGASQPMLDVYEKIKMSLDNDSTVLITGETGTGKDMVARTIHYNSKRAQGPFIAVNCAALPEELIESELFGYKKGAFTGAVSDTVGIFRAANSGTVYLDEITEMPLPCQAKLLRVIQERVVRPIGASEEIPVNVRVVCSTNRNIDSMTVNSQFRQDLFYRISVLRIELPPLRTRKEDIPLLVNSFIEKFNKKFNKNITGIDSNALMTLNEHNWKGNIRELENVIERTFLTIRSSKITFKDLPTFDKSDKGSKLISLNEAQRRVIIEALRATNGNKSKSASILGITRKRLYNLIKKYKI